MPGERGRPPLFTLQRYYDCYGRPKAHVPLRDPRTLWDVANWDPDQSRERASKYFGKEYAELFVDWRNLHLLLEDLERLGDPIRPASALERTTTPGSEALWLPKVPDPVTEVHRVAHDFLFGLLCELVPTFPCLPTQLLLASGLSDDLAASGYWDVQNIVDRMKQRRVAYMQRGIVNVSDLVRETPLLANRPNAWFTTNLPFPSWERCDPTARPISLLLCWRGGRRRAGTRYDVPRPCPSCPWPQPQGLEGCGAPKCAPTVIGNGRLNLAQGGEELLHPAGPLRRMASRPRRLGGFGGGRPRKDHRPVVFSSDKGVEEAFRDHVRRYKGQRAPWKQIVREWNDLHRITERIAVNSTAKSAVEDLL